MANIKKSSPTLVDVQSSLNVQSELVAKWHGISHPLSIQMDDVIKENLSFLPNDIAKPFLSNHYHNYRLWHFEDEARSDEAKASHIVLLKRSIDKANQMRNDAIQLMDEILLSHIELKNGSLSDAPLFSETPGSVLDRCSILSLKIYHMRAHVEDSKPESEHKKMCEMKCAILLNQFTAIP